MRFVDSLAFITAPLKDFPKIFDLDVSSFSKGFFLIVSLKLKQTLKILVIFLTKNILEHK